MLKICQGLHFEYFNAFSLILMVLGGILGYGSKYVLKIFIKNPAEKTIVLFKFLGLLLVALGAIIIFIK